MVFLMKLGFVIGLLIVALSAVFLSKKYMSLQADQIIEDTIEDVIKNETGIDFGSNDHTQSELSQKIADVITKEINTVID